MILLRLSAAVPESGDPFHPHVRVPVAGAWSREDLDEVASHLQRGDCVHLTLTIPHEGRFLTARRRGRAGGETGVRDRLADLARVAGPDAGRLLVRIERQQGALRRCWETWAWRRGIGGARHPMAPERRLDELLAQPAPSLDETYARETGPCEGKPHVPAAAAAPLAWDVIDDLHGWVSVGREAHLVLTVPHSPVSRDADLHLLWERRMALDVADREGEVAQLWPGTTLVRVEVVRIHPTAGRSRWARRSARRTP